MGPLGQQQRQKLEGAARQGCAGSAGGAGMQAQLPRPSGARSVVPTGTSPIPWGCRKTEQQGIVQMHRRVEFLLPGQRGEQGSAPGSRGSSRGPFSPGWAEANRQPNHRLCDSKPEPFSVSCFLTGMAGGAELRTLRN